MKKVILLHGTGGTAKGNWFPWLKAELEKQGYTVWAPDLPSADRPSINRYNHFLFSRGFEFDDQTTIIGHSSGSVAILGLLQALPEASVIKKAILVGAFKDNLGRDELDKLFTEEVDFEKIKSRAKEFVFIHSDDDPFCPLEGAKYLAKKLNGTMKILPGYKHFSYSTGGERFLKLPEMLQFIT